MDPKTPAQYSFLIQSTSTPSIIFYSDLFTLTVKCPETIEYSVQGLFPYKESFVGATGSNASYIFPRTISTLPKCSNVIKYLIEEVTPLGSVDFDPNCDSDPCRTVMFDTTEERAISFKIRP